MPSAFSAAFASPLNIYLVNQSFTNSSDNFLAFSQICKICKSYLFKSGRYAGKISVPASEITFLASSKPSIKVCAGTKFPLIWICGSIGPSSDLSSIKISSPDKTIIVAALFAIFGTMKRILSKCSRNIQTIDCVASAEPPGLWIITSTPFLSKPSTISAKQVLSSQVIAPAGWFFFKSEK